MPNINAHLINPKHVMFSHLDLEDGTQTYINITLLAEAVKDLEIVQAPVCQKHAEFCIKYRGVETHRLQRLLDVKPSDPVLFASWPDGTYLLIDGTHRYVAAAMRKEVEIKARIIPEEIWRKFQLVGVKDPNPMQTLSKFSGIL
jgi:hypothetical protein